MRPLLAIIALNAAVVGAALSGSAFASSADDEVIATAQAKPTAQALSAQAPPAPVATSATPPLTTQQQIDSFIYSSPPMDQDHRGLLPADRDEDGKRKIHGSMGVSVGSGGYRSGYASALIPVGETTTVGIAVSQTDFGKSGGFYSDPYYGGGGYYGGGYGTNCNPRSRWYNPYRCGDQYEGYGAGYYDEPYYGGGYFAPSIYLGGFGGGYGRGYGGGHGRGYGGGGYGGGGYGGGRGGHGGGGYGYGGGGHHR